MIQPIEIVGGGLAGLSLGIGLRHAAVPVTILEAGEYPRHRACGEFIAGLTGRTVKRLGLEDVLGDALQHREVAWFIAEKCARIQRLPRPALGISRHALDARLAEQFTRLGGVLRTRTRVVDTARLPGRVFASGRRRGGTSWIGLKFHARNLALTRELELHLGADAYVGLSRIEGDAANVCGLFRRRALSVRGPRLLLEYLDACELRALAARLRGAAIAPESFCAVAALDFDHRGPCETGLRLGDACAMIPPFTGNGMAMAFQSAETALAPLVAYARGKTDWAGAARVTNAALRGRFRVRLASARFLHPFLLHRPQQRWLAALSRARLLPFRPLYAALH